MIDNDIIRLYRKVQTQFIPLPWTLLRESRYTQLFRAIKESDTDRHPHIIPSWSDDTDTFKNGQLIEKDNELYVIKNHVKGNWDATFSTVIEPRIAIVPDFDPTRDFIQREYCWHEDKLWINGQHTIGEWDPANWIMAEAEFPVDFAVFYSLESMRIGNRDIEPGKLAPIGTIMEPFLPPRAGEAVTISDYVYVAKEPFAHFDFNDITTLYQDIDGTVPVTADGDPVHHIKSTQSSVESNTLVSRDPLVPFGIYQTDSQGKGYVSFKNQPNIDIDSAVPWWVVWGFAGLGGALTRNAPDLLSTEDIQLDKLSTLTFISLKENIAWAKGLTLGYHQNAKTYDSGLSTSIRNLFRGSYSEYWDTLADWDVTGVEFFDYMFSESNVDVDLSQWDVSSAKSMTGFLNKAVDFYSPIFTVNAPDLTDVRFFFRGAKIFNFPVSDWVMPAVTSTEGMFSGAMGFNQPINTWVTGSLTTTRDMFKDARNFNSPIGNALTGAINDVSGMFNGAYDFNQPLNGLQSNSILLANQCFKRARSFNQSLAHWDLVSAIDITEMFMGASAYNQPLTWDLYSVVRADRALQDTTALNQDYSQWFTDTASVDGLLVRTGLTIAQQPKVGYGYRYGEFDFTDTTRLFKDTAMTIPATTVGDPVVAVQSDTGLGQLVATDPLNPPILRNGLAPLVQTVTITFSIADAAASMGNFTQVIPDDWLSVSDDYGITWASVLENTSLSGTGETGADYLTAVQSRIDAALGLLNLPGVSGTSFKGALNVGFVLTVTGIAQRVRRNETVLLPFDSATDNQAGVTHINVITHAGDAVSAGNLYVELTDDRNFTLQRNGVSVTDPFYGVVLPSVGYTYGTKAITVTDANERRPVQKLVAYRRIDGTQLVNLTSYLNAQRLEYPGTAFDYRGLYAGIGMDNVNGNYKHWDMRRVFNLDLAFNSPQTEDVSLGLWNVSFWDADLLAIPVNFSGGQISTGYLPRWGTTGLGE